MRYEVFGFAWSDVDKSHSGQHLTMHTLNLKPQNLIINLISQSRIINIMLIPLHVIDPQLFAIFSSRSFYASQKLLQFENQAHTNHFNTSS